MKLRTKLIATATGGALMLSGLAFATSAVGDEGEEKFTGIAKERHEAMEALGGSVKAIGGMLKGAVPYDQDVVNAKTAKIAEVANSDFLALFPEGTNEPPSIALDVIWEDWDGFSEAAALFKDRADALAAASDQEAVAAAFMPAVKTCGGCHTKFRKDDD